MTDTQTPISYCVVHIRSLDFATIQIFLGT